MSGAHKSDEEGWDRFADVGRAALVGGAIVLPRRPASNQARVSAGTCLLAIELLTKLLKRAVPERRPDGENNKSFPSDHAAECIAAALIIERQYPGQIGALAYALAVAVSRARIESRKHHPRDVLAGALIGCASVWMTLKLQLAIDRGMHAGSS